MAGEATLLLIKPDAIQRGLVGAVWSRLEPLRLEVVGAKAVRVSRELAQEHYYHLKDRPFFGELVEYLQGKLHGTSYVLAFVLWGDQAVARVRDVVGATNPEQADPASIRGAFGRLTTAGLMENLVHAASDPREAEREIRLWFKPHELLRPVGCEAPPLGEGRGEAGARAGSGGR
jgi:nucleoside-diphosphate kinase